MYLINLFNLSILSGIEKDITFCQNGSLHIPSSYSLSGIEKDITFCQNGSLHIPSPHSTLALRTPI